MNSYTVLVATRLYSLSDIITIILGACAAIVTVSGAIAAILKWVNKAKEPTKLIVERIKKCEERLNNHDDRFLKINEVLEVDKNTVRDLKRENKITLKTLLAMMEYMLNDSDPSKLVDAKQSLHDFLVNKE